MLLEILHGHGAQIEQLVRDFVGFRQFRGDFDIMENAIHLVQNLQKRSRTDETRMFVCLYRPECDPAVCTYLAGEKATVLTLDVLAEAHLQQSKPHMQSLYDVGLAS